MLAKVFRFGAEQRVNTHTDGVQDASSITMLSNNNWIVTWTSENQDGDGYGIYQQQYYADGTPIGGEQRVNTTTAGSQADPSVTALVDGGWIVTWTSYSPDGSEAEIYQQRYRADGTARDGEVRVNTFTADQQAEPTVTALPFGGWVVTWTSRDQDGSGWGIYQQRYDSNGNPLLTTDERVNTTLQSDQSSPSITTLADGGWVVTWTSSNGSTTDIFQQRYNAGGGRVGGEQIVNTYAAGDQSLPEVVALTDGGWVVTWTSSEQDGSEYGVYQQRYNANGSPRGGEQKVNTTTVASQEKSSIAAMPDGGWVVTWTSGDQDGSGSGIYQQRYDSNGMPVGGEQRVNTTTQSDQYGSNVTSGVDGSWIVTWTSENQDGSGAGVYQRVYSYTTAFGEGQEYSIGSAANETFYVVNGGLETGDSLEAGGGIDTLRMLEGGTFDLTAPDVLTGIEIIQGSSGNDVIEANESTLAGVIAIRGGAGIDELRLQSGSYDFSALTLSGIEAITVSDAGPTSLVFDDKATALLTRAAAQNITLVLVEDVFTLAERQKLYDQGFREVTDVVGTHVLQRPDASLARNSVQENAGTGTVVGDFSVVDPNIEDGFTLDLVDSAGGRFAISGNRLVVANGAPIDHEAATSHTVVVRITDQGGLAVDKAFTVSVSNIPVETLMGSAGADRLTGGTSKDVLYGGLGKDTLTGGAGEDAFVFDTKPNARSNRDTISDFSVKDDAIWLDNAVFAKLGKAGSVDKPAALKSSLFATGSKAKDKDDHLIYDKAKGVLLYDADGSGKGKAVEIATLSKGLALKASDFFVI
ncbi:hypothetical protein [Microvirga arsenatis]|uniref:Cadherin domain-containing protein n=1 Tax=Microvirga arsenatis TaxID=2692265 RepID=A0ABW9Z1C9_9HYPH|nr:hypothetical protein [Microvirga arsenatis]NBJ11494.1 hypothetical protein [Microvirga arsenatis]NBJ26332.1 hypothetical protein [Microvirga arsenatis]